MIVVLLVLTLCEFNRANEIYEYSSDIPRYKCRIKLMQWHFQAQDLPTYGYQHCVPNKQWFSFIQVNYIAHGSSLNFILDYICNKISPSPVVVGTHTHTHTHVRILHQIETFAVWSNHTNVCSKWYRIQCNRFFFVALCVGSWKAAATKYITIGNSFLIFGIK